jgi:hypothetical protein
MIPNPITRIPPTPTQKVNVRYTIIQSQLPRLVRDLNQWSNHGNSWGSKVDRFVINRSLLKDLPVK